jgi:hypothetical protein
MKSSAGRYERLMSIEHLDEVFRLTLQLRREALRGAHLSVKEQHSRGGLTVRRSSQELVLVMTISPHSEGRVYDLSCSLDGGHLPSPVGVPLMLALAQNLRCPAPVSIGQSERGVFYLQMKLDPEQDTAYRETPLEPVDEDSIASILQAALEQARSIDPDIVQTKKRARRLLAREGDRVKGRPRRTQATTTDTTPGTGTPPGGGADEDDDEQRSH